MILDDIFIKESVWESAILYDVVIKLFPLSKIWKSKWNFSICAIESFDGEKWISIQLANRKNYFHFCENVNFI